MHKGKREGKSQRRRQSGKRPVQPVGKDYSVAGKSVKVDTCKAILQLLLPEAAVVAAASKAAADAVDGRQYDDIRDGLFPPGLQPSTAFFF